MARQRLGQHFLSSPAWQQRILDRLPFSADDVWVEIGAGHGEMTRHLAQRARRVVTIETDVRLADNLQRNIESGVEEWRGIDLAEGDVLSLDIGKLVGPSAGGERFRVYGNLPYYITSPILHHLFQWADRIASIHIVIQLEVAERIAARPGPSSSAGGRNYGYLSVACQYYAQPEIALKLPPGAFRPPPKVDSALVSMTIPGERTALAIDDDEAFLEFVRLCFAQKRKTLRNNLRAVAPDNIIRRAIAECGLPEDVRAERLSVKEFVLLRTKILSSEKDSVQAGRANDPAHRS